MKHFPYTAIVLLFVGLTFAVFKGWLKPKSKWEYYGTNVLIQSNRFYEVDTNIFAVTNGTLYVSNRWPPEVYSYNREAFIKGSWFTNIVISNDFQGTIQIGTNFWRPKDCSVWHNWPENSNEAKHRKNLMEASNSWSVAVVPTWSIPGFKELTVGVCKFCGKPTSFRSHTVKTNAP